MRMIRVQQKDSGSLGTLINPMHVVCVIGNDQRSAFYLTDKRMVASSWPLENAEAVLRDAME